MKKLCLSFCIALVFSIQAFSQSADPWKIRTGKIDPSNYYGITVGNGVIGIVSSPEPFKVKDVVLAGAYDLYGRGRVSNFLRSFNLLDMHHAAFTTTFDYGDKASVTYTYYSLRHSPFTVLMDVEIKAKKDISITG